MNVREFLKDKKNKDGRFFKTVTCADGFTISIQASEYHYCSPRENDADWYEVELGFPSEKDEMIQRWAENEKEPEYTVYGYVPIQVVQDLLNKHNKPVSSFSIKDALNNHLNSEA